MAQSQEQLNVERALIALLAVRGIAFFALRRRHAAIKKAAAASQGPSASDGSDGGA